MTIEPKRIAILKYIRQNGKIEAMNIKAEFLPNGYSNEDVDEILHWIENNKWVDRDNRGNEKLNSKCLDILDVIDNEIEKKSREQIELNEKNISARWWDRLIDNAYKIIGVPILLWTAILQYNQVDNNADIKKLQEKLKEDSIQFSTILHDIENQLIQHNKKLKYIPSNTKVDSLLNKLKVDNTTKNK